MTDNTTNDCTTHIDRAPDALSVEAFAFALGGLLNLGMSVSEAIDLLNAQPGVRGDLLDAWVEFFQTDTDDADEGES